MELEKKQKSEIEIKKLQKAKEVFDEIKRLYDCFNFQINEHKMKIIFEKISELETKKIRKVCDELIMNCNYAPTIAQIVELASVELRMQRELEKQFKNDFEFSFVIMGRNEN